MVALEIPQHYGYVLLLVIVSAVQLTVAGFLAMGPRKKIFTKEFFEKNFPEEVKAGKIDTKHFGYPDTGSGKYSMVCTHDEWQAMNNAQRGHINFMEIFPQITLFFLIAGLTFPRAVVGLQIINVIGRFLYQQNYAKKGPQARLPGAGLNLVALAGSMILSVLSAISLLG